MSKSIEPVEGGGASDEVDVSAALLAIFLPVVQYSCTVLMITGELRDVIHETKFLR